MLKYNVNTYTIKISMCGTENIYRLKLYRTQIKSRCIQILEIHKIHLKPVEW